MATKSKAQLEAELEATKAEVLGLKTQLHTQRLRMQNDYVERSEYNRVQGVLTNTQRWLAKYKRQAQDAQPVSERRAAMEAAKAEAMATGRSVAVR